MNQNDLLTFTLSLNWCIFFFILLPGKSFSADSRYEACLRQQQHCANGPNISFPFYIQGLQQSYCGYPGFNLSCDIDGFPTLRIPDNYYIIEEIFYHNRSLVIRNSAFQGPEESCLPEIRNTSLDSSKFSYVNTSNLYLLSNCSKEAIDRLGRFRVGCDDQNREKWDLAMFREDENFSYALQECNTSVVAPVELHENEERNGIDYYKGLLTRGFLVNWTASDCSECDESGGFCGFETDIFHFRCFCPDRPHARSCKPSRKKHRKVIVLSVVPGVCFLLICAGIFIMKRRKKGTYFLSRNLSAGPSSRQGIEGGSKYFGVSVFSYTELEKATNNFDSSKELGDGGFGTVYYGKLRDGREVAVKRLYEHNCKRMEQFRNEIEILTRLRHPNLVTLYGCTSRRSRELLLVYEFVHNGTVADHLHGDRVNEGLLTWPIRMKIAYETASALAYLHASDIIHRDVKTNNILLDHNFCVKVADFGLSRLFPNDVSHISTAPQGTPGYVDPEYHECYQLTDKSDVYSFGVVLIELVSSMPAVDIGRHRHEINLANLAINRIQRCAFNELIDQSLGFETDSEVWRMTTAVAELAFRCLQLQKDMRPTMEEILNILVDIQQGEKLEDEKAKLTEESGNVPRNANVPPSPESEDVVLLKQRNLPTSPDSVVDHKWVSSSSSTSISG